MPGGYTGVPGAPNVLFLDPQHCYARVCVCVCVREREREKERERDRMIFTELLISLLHTFLSVKYM